MDDELSVLIGAIAESASLSARSRGVDVEPYFAVTSHEGEVMVTAFEPGYLAVLNDKTILGTMMRRLMESTKATSAGFGMTCGVASYQAGDEVGRRRIERAGVGDDPGYCIWASDGTEERIFCSPIELVDASSARLSEWIVIPGRRISGGVLANAVRDILGWGI